MAEREVDRSVSQTVKAQLALRDQILSGSLRPGERISELQAVETTGASRTPVRMALVRLEEEGLLEAIPSGGFMVKAFSSATSPIPSSCAARWRALPRVSPPSAAFPRASSSR